MIRACVAMAYPPAAGQGEEPRDSVTPSTLAHWDMHNENCEYPYISSVSYFHPVLHLPPYTLRYPPWFRDIGSNLASDKLKHHYLLSSSHVRRLRQ